MQIISPGTKALDGTLVGGLGDPAVAGALDLCLACKGCASDCPTGVDMATYKSEALHQRYDGDGSTDPAEIPRFVEALVEGADLAKGSRFCRDGGSDDITRFRRLGNYGLNWLVNRIFRTQFSDLCYGYNAFWRRNLDCLDLPCTDVPEPQWGDGFEIETVINVRAAKSGWLIREVGSFEGKRLHGNSNLNAVTDGMRVLRTIGREHRERVGGARVPAGAGWSP